MQQTENIAPHVEEITRALKNRMEPEAIEDELRRYLEYGVPLAQAKKDIVRMHGGTLNAGEKKLDALLPEDRGVDVTAKILTVNPKEVTARGEQKTIWYGLMADETTKIPYTAWKDHGLERGTVVHIKNAYAKKGFRDPVELSLGDYTEVEKVDVEMDVADDFVGREGGEPGTRMSVDRKVRDLRDGMSSVNVVGRLLDVRQKDISTVNGPKTLTEGELADETGRVPFSAWEPEKLPEGFEANAVVSIKNAYVKSFRNLPNVNFGQYATIEIMDDATVPDKASLMEEKPFTMGELDAAGGGEGVKVTGIVLEIKKGSGIIFRCPHAEDDRVCNRVLQRQECRIHGKQKGTPDMRIKAVLDDGYGAGTFIAGREITEKILGKSMDEAQEMAREAMTVDVVQDELADKLTARRMTVRGRAMSDDYGLQIIATDVEYAPEVDLESDAEKLLGSLTEVLQEVSE